MELKEGYKQTEVGITPTEWNVTELAKIGQLSKGKGLLKHEIFPSGSIPAIPYTAIYTDFNEILAYEKIKWFVEDATSSVVVSNPCVLIASSSNMDANTGKATAITGEIPVAVGREVIIFQTLHNVSFISYLLSTSSYRKKTLSLARGTTIKHVYPETFKNYKICIPDSAEQDAIASALSDADALIESLEQLTAKKRQIKQGATQELLTGQRRLPGFIGKWNVKKLGSVADVIDPHPSHRAPNEVSNGVPFLGIGDLDECGNVIGKNLRIVDYSILEEHARRYSLDDELIGLGRVASIGKVVKLNKHGDGYAISPTLGVIRGREAKRSYLLYALGSNFVTAQFVKIMSGSTRSSVGMEVLRELHVQLPPSEEEQTAIAAILEDMDTELEALESRLTKARQIKQGLMQELLTGRTRLL